MKTPTKYYQFEVQRGENEPWIRVGHRYTDKKLAAGWRSFVKAAWHGIPIRLSTFTLTPAGRAAVEGLGKGGGK